MSFKLFGIIIKINFWFLFVLALLSYFDKSGIIIFSFLSIIIHETGHLTAMVLTENKPKEVNFGAYGIIIKSSRSPSFNNAILIEFSGPAANIISTALFTVVFQLTEAQSAILFAAVSLIIAIFSLLPIKGLDGGTIVREILEHYLDIGKSGVITSVLNAAGILFLIVSGIVLALKSGNFSLIITAVFLIATQ